jgi:hypothetical protein
LLANPRRRESVLAKHV